MRKVLLLVALMLIPAVCWGQSSQVKIALGSSYANGIINIVAINYGTTAGVFTYSLDSNGGIILANMSQGRQHGVFVCKSNGTSCLYTTIVPTGATQDITTALQANPFSGTGSVGTCSTVGGWAYYAAAGTAVSCLPFSVASITALQGTDTKVLTSGTIAGTGASLCTDANGGATTSGCTSVAASGTLTSGTPTEGAGASSVKNGVLADFTTFGLAPLASPALTGTPTAPTPTVGDNTTTLATTAFVQSAVTSSNPAVAVKVATTAAGDTSGLAYSNGVGGIGATLTGTVNTAVTIDGVTFTAVGQRLLVKNDTQSPSGAFNGVYFLSQLQTGILAPVFTRALDYDMPSDINNTGLIPVTSGTANATTAWLLTSQVTTVGTDPLTYVQFSTGSSPVNSGTAPQAAYYAANGAVLSGISLLQLDLIAGGRTTSLVQDGSGSTPVMSGIVALTGGAGSFSNAVATATDPPYRTTTTGSVSGNNTGISTDRTTYWSSTARPGIEFVGKISATATNRTFFCLSDQSIATLGGSDTPAGNSACIRYSTNASDTNFMCGSSSGGSWTFTSTGVAADTNVHTFTILVNGTSNVTCYVDGAHATAVSTNVMAAGTTLGWAISMTTLAASGVTVSYATVKTRSTF